MSKPKAVEYPTLDDLAGVILCYQCSGESQTTLRRLDKIYHEAQAMQDAERDSAPDKRKAKNLRYKFVVVA